MNNKNLKLTFLGTGTSMGVPVIGCDCETCRSTDPRDRRLRTSALVEGPSGSLLIDCGPDFRYQMLRTGSPAVDAILLTHIHYDHTGGIDDLRPYCLQLGPDGELPLYCRADVAEALRVKLPYCFGEHLYPGVPRILPVVIAEGERLSVAGFDVTVLGVNHGSLPILGYRIGPLGYITDCLTMPEATRDALRGVDTLVVNALRKKPHASHMNLAQALDVIRDIKPRRAYLTHLCDQMGRHADVSKELPQGVEIAYDGLTIEIPNNYERQSYLS